MSYIKVQQDETLTYVPEQAEEYNLQLKIILAFGIEPDLFVYRVVDDSYSHPAMVYDLHHFPNTKEQAIRSGLAFYRKSSANFVFLNKELAVTSKNSILARLRLVNKEWQKQIDVPYGGVAVTIFDSGVQ